ncbi:MAG: ABC transporter permease [Spirochaetales bacterium]|nr:ABC transporter permease [Spirochaetales bacterium]
MKVLFLKHAFRNIFRNRFRSISILLTTGICSAVLIVIGGFYDYLFRSVENEVIAEQGHIKIYKKASGESSGDFSQEMWECTDYDGLEKDILNCNNVSMVTPRLVISGLAGFDEKTAIFQGDAVVFERENMINAILLHGKTPLSTESETSGVHIGKILARNLGVGRGDIINLLVQTDIVKGISFTVTDVITTVSEELDRVYIKMPLKPVQTLLDTNKLHSMHVFLKENKDTDAIKNRIGEIIKKRGLDLKVSLYNESGSYFEEVQNVYMNNYYFILMVIMITIFFSIANTITMAIMERVKEMGTLRSFGMSIRHLIVLFIYEGFFLGLFGYAFGIFIAVSGSTIINSIGGIYIPPPPTEEKGFYAIINISLVPLFISFIIATGVSVLSSFISTLKITSLTIIDELGHI